MPQNDCSNCAENAPKVTDSGRDSEDFRERLGGRQGNRQSQCHPRFPRDEVFAHGLKGEKGGWINEVKRFAWCNRLRAGKIGGFWDKSLLNCRRSVKSKTLPYYLWGRGICQKGLFALMRFGVTTFSHRLTLNSHCSPHFPTSLFKWNTFRLEGFQTFVFCLKKHFIFELNAWFSAWFWGKV